MTKPTNGTVQQIDNSGKKVELSRILAFSVPSLALAGLGLPFVIQLPPHYTNYVGISLGVVGALFMAARLFDVIIDLVIGILMDQTKTKIGRFTPWLLAGSIPMSIFSWFLFMAKPGVSPWYLAISLFGAYVTFSIGTLAQLGVGNSLSKDYHERSKIFSFWQAFNIIGMLLVLSIPAIVQATGGSAAEGVQKMGLFVIVAMPLGALVSHLFAKEQVSNIPIQRSNFADVKALIGLDSFKRLLAADLILSFASGVIGGLLVYFLSSVKGYGDSSSIMLLAYFVCGLACTPIWVKVSRKIGKHGALSTAIGLLGISLSMVIFMPKDNFLLAIIMVAISGVGYAAPLYFVRAMASDVGDEDKLITKKDRTGMIFALISLTSKVGYALSVGISYPLLQAFGFDPKSGVSNSNSALIAFEFVYFGFPILCYLVSIYILKDYKLTSERVAEVQSLLELEANEQK